MQFPPEQTKVYFAARYSSHPEMRQHRDWLKKTYGIEVTSRWIDCHTDVVGDFTSSFTVEVLNERAEECAPLGQHDLDDIDLADVVISFTGQGGAKGGRHVEFGYAYARGKTCIVIGPCENVFHTLPSVRRFPDWQSFRRYLMLNQPPLLPEGTTLREHTTEQAREQPWAG